MTPKILPGHCAKRCPGVKFRLPHCNYITFKSQSQEKFLWAFRFT